MILEPSTTTLLVSAIPKVSALCLLFQVAALLMYVSVIAVPFHTAPVVIVPNVVILEEPDQSPKLVISLCVIVKSFFISDALLPSKPDAVNLAKSLTEAEPSITTLLVLAIPKVSALCLLFQVAELLICISVIAVPFHTAPAPIVPNVVILDEPVHDDKSISLSVKDKSFLSCVIVLPSKPLSVNLAKLPLNTEPSITTLFVLSIPKVNALCLLFQVAATINIIICYCVTLPDTTSNCSSSC